MNGIKTALLGVVVADALGTRYEFLSCGDATHKVHNDTQGDFLPILGGGPFHMEPGQVTDDSEMAMTLLFYLATQNKYLQPLVANGYITWYKSNPPDIGNTIKSALNGSVSEYDCVQKANKYSLSNGLLMRITPLAVFAFIKKMDNIVLFETVKKEAKLTHAHNFMPNIGYIYCRAVIDALSGLSKKEIYENSLLNTNIIEIKNVLRGAKQKPEPVYVVDYKTKKDRYVYNDEAGYRGYVGIALQNAFYELLYGKDYESSIINIVKRGGDTDTNAAIAGGLLGAYYGKIDSRWVNSVLNPKNKITRYDQYPLANPNLIQNCLNQLLSNL